MREDQFRMWLSGTSLQERPQRDAVSRCKRVEKYEGDLEIHFADDNLESLIDKLTYSRTDDSSGIAPRHSIPINGDLVNGTSSLRSAIKLYQQFCVQFQK